jgi:hypothetical protein
MFILGRDCYGKKQPELTYDFAAILSKDPTISVPPSGLTVNAILGEAI